MTNHSEKVREYKIGFEREGLSSADEYVRQMDNRSLLSRGIRRLFNIGDCNPKYGAASELREDLYFLIQNTL